MNNQAQFTSDLCIALDQTASCDNNQRLQAEGFIQQVSTIVFLGMGSPISFF